MGVCECISPDENLWQATNVDLAALQRIVSSHFRTTCRNYTQIGEGSYARVFLFYLSNGMKVVGRVVLPVRKSLKTEAEVATMQLVRGRTTVPVPEVYLYCSTPDNPVRAEWIIMQYMPGKLMADCLENLTDAQNLRTAMDLAEIMASIFQITAPRCGSILPVHQSCRDDSALDYISPKILSAMPNIICTTDLPDVAPVSERHCCIGPVNDITFLDYPQELPAYLCGPFDTERQWMEAFAHLGRPARRSEDTPRLSWAYEKTLDVYDIVSRFYWSHFSSSPGEKEVFHLAHGDLSSYNILVDPDSGAITGLIDWEMAGFRPAWLAAAAGGWLNDDSERFLMTDYQSSHGKYEGETPADAMNRVRFRLRLAQLDDKLYRHNLQGMELRALFYACCYACYGNTEIWLDHYRVIEWSEKQRGPFPFDYVTELLAVITLEESLPEEKDARMITASSKPSMLREVSEDSEELSLSGGFNYTLLDGVHVA